MEETPQTPQEPIKEEVKAEAPKVESTDSMIARAETVAKRMEEQNAKAEAIAKRMEEIYSRVLISGKSEGGQVRKTKEQEQEEEIKKQVEASLKRFNF